MFEKLDEEFEYTHKQLERAVTAKNQTASCWRPAATASSPICPGRSDVPKTLIFAKDDAGTEEIVTTVPSITS